MLKFCKNDYFRSVWNQKTKKQILKMLEDFLVITNICNEKPLLIYGSLLGCKRNHEIIPWDGDVDFCLERHKNYDNIKKMLNQFYLI